MQASERAHNFVVEFFSNVFNRRRGGAISITVPISAVQTQTLDVDADEMSNGRRSPSLIPVCLWASTTLAVESPTDLFVASHWLERSSSRFSVTLFVFSRADHNTSQVLTTFYVVFISTFFYWRLASKASKLLRPPLIGPPPWCHTARLIVMHVVFRSLLKILGYAAKQACKLLHCNKAKLLEPASINGLHNTRVYVWASLLSASTLLHLTSFTHVRRNN